MISCAIVGAQKCATSSLLYSLTHHPDIAIHEQREMSFFVNDDLYEQGWAQVEGRYFPEQCNRLKTIKNVGLMYHEHSLDRLKSHNSDIKIIVSLRDPVKRALSAYDFFKMQGKEDAKTFHEALKKSNSEFDSGNDYLRRGDYYKQINNLYSRFPKNNVTVVLTEDLAENSEAVFRNIAKFICGQDRIEWKPQSKPSNSAKKSRNPALAKFSTKNFPGRRLLKNYIPSRMRDTLRSNFETLNSTQAEKSKQTNETLELLHSFYDSKTDKLSQLIERDLSHWKHD